MTELIMFHCHSCGSHLDYSKAKLKNHNIVVLCKKCNVENIVEEMRKCEKCGELACSLKITPDLYDGCKTESYCRDHLPKSWITRYLEDGNLYAKGKYGGEPRLIRSNVLCEMCGEPAQRIKQGRWGGNERYFCSKHIDSGGQRCRACREPTEYLVCRKCGHDNWATIYIFILSLILAIHLSLVYFGWITFGNIPDGDMSRLQDHEHLLLFISLISIVASPIFLIAYISCFIRYFKEMILGIKIRSQQKQK